MNTPLIVICGATATGKSGLALTLAQRLDSIIISADSRQVYREFDIGTAKPTHAEQDLVPHYLIDICSPTQTFTVADYQDKVTKLLQSTPCLSPSLLVGGTGLYIKSIVRGLKIPRVAPQPQLRQELEALGQAQCYAMLNQVDSLGAHKIHPHDQVRTLRALEVFYVTGVPISQQQGEYPPTYPILQIGLDSTPDALEKRIEQRTQMMLTMGLVKEVETLMEKYGSDLPLLNTLGYAEIKEYLQGKMSLDQAKAAIILHTRQFAKRQRTWFRSYREIQWFDPTSVNFLDNVWMTIQQFLA
ncbi:tRNA delta(2)-isopentenylpyrophosphate transferase [Rippkaea orientalis PCC 8801]|uniref:tRNA dimethylallyltransferase n=1 Tax=Rippkaea orientalis (strain PCC 8801 / RF-1) TaxID=41431 RepID=MIAA_RIPO1|nr:tRNA (adenosine(37)-N6)-dimethylallyltransferase MiaA [Rippkaea orientalis]B7K612.1 RecName: Full=tRNA dimethylallyltransferase; AltName: Full=Dimethylallyl diphosphate:tRNA dimethylallyltransferase; Short=DMAPP:tRNA dimethylallyltransferase; Short=DMATase; AltName: Full=Isopentenyl-diphosphate:tRNA isopentenyltransferase; Short=IPP transferase; Short=IPPT; Short=IPTase [Rippkaea orientalis PCC 8801]ACK68065.1 tRNA delta(2)-isopentenylpyrophosphate transferase [Rippkaea orientalis PCC 8801]